MGTTSTGSVDPVTPIAERGAAEGVWLHVDAADAGPAMVCPELRWAFEGVKRADSLVVNAHKWLLTPADCSCVWSRRGDDLRAAHSLVPEFLRTPEDAASLADYGPALGRRFRSLKLWALLARENATGELFISHTKLNGRYVLRLAIGNAGTTEDDVRHAWEVLSECAP